MVSKLWMRILLISFTATLNISCNHLFYYPDSLVHVDITKTGLSYKSGMLNTKDPSGFFSPLSNIAVGAFTLEIPGEI